jgi:hypothetical protein
MFKLRYILYGYIKYPNRVVLSSIILLRKLYIYIYIYIIRFLGIHLSNWIDCTELNWISFIYLVHTLAMMSLFYVKIINIVEIYNFLQKKPLFCSFLSEIIFIFFFSRPLGLPIFWSQILTRPQAWQPVKCLRLPPLYETVLFSNMSTPIPGSNQHSIQFFYPGEGGVLSSGENQFGREANHSPLFSAEFKNEWRSTSTLPCPFLSYIGTTTP